VPLVVAVLVLLLAELTVRVTHAHLAAPSAWPSPELQKKYDQIVARESKHRPSDVVLVGDSMMDAAGDPEELSADGAPASIYNASIAGETLPTIAQWTEKVVVPRLHPKVVVVGFSSNELNPASLAAASGIFAYDHSRAVRAAEGDGDIVDRGDAFLRQWSYLYRYRTDLRHPLGQPAAPAFDPALTASGEDLAFFDQHYLEGSALHVRQVIAGTIAALQGFRIGPQNVTILADLFTSLRKQGISVLFVVMPVTSDLVGFHPHGTADYQNAVTAFKAIADDTGAQASVPGIWPTTDFADPVHLNGAGTALFSRYLAPLLRQNTGGGS
jgi:lysophospholipase L1-like esterase